MVSASACQPQDHGFESCKSQLASHKLPRMGYGWWQWCLSSLSCKWVQLSPPLIRPPSLPRNCGHIREVPFDMFDDRDKYITVFIMFIVVRPKMCGHSRDGGPCWEWPLKEGPLYLAIDRDGNCICITHGALKHVCGCILPRELNRWWM